MLVIYFENFDNYQAYKDKKEFSFDYKTFQKGFLERIVLIISVQSLKYAKFKIPLTTKKRIEQVLRYEIVNTYGEVEYHFFYHIVDKDEKFMTVNCWLIENDVYQQILKEFKPKYVLPEDIFYSDVDSGIIVEKNKYGYNLVAVNKGIIIENLFMKEFDSFQWRLFCRSIENYLKIFKKLVMVNCDLDIDVKEFGNLEKNFLKLDHSYCLYAIKNVRINKYKIKYGKRYDIVIIVLVAAIGLILGMSFKIFQNNCEFDNIIKNQKEQINQIKKAISSHQDVDDNETMSELLRAVEKRLEKYNDPLIILEYLAKSFDNNTQIKSVEFVDNNLKVMIYTGNPFEMVNYISKHKCVKSVRITNALVKDRDNKYNVYYNLELSGCIN